MAKHIETIEKYEIVFGRTVAEFNSNCRQLLEPRIGQTIKIEPAGELKIVTHPGEHDFEFYQLFKRTITTETYA